MNSQGTALAPHRWHRTGTAAAFAGCQEETASTCNFPVVFGCFGDLGSPLGERSKPGLCLQFATPGTGGGFGDKGDPSRCLLLGSVRPRQFLGGVSKLSGRNSSLEQLSR